ncbi:hypothetical protein TTHERM_00500870 (macronuclear) [Tetrahymena thermophila SB210]|uniref:Uncharacterized protein n=1 Tax=Tetrahymena thermophila (strain SB210) TaxID=312017 RepID=I7MLF5_TETTS|nr:hypothetical protein TTHERM_00500870 [Tetrahymena thermophila SB210]EAS02001.1 hypothetical protein TTHERM_00500870 [Tetrahymena thermophila SB210]|eukprot:XP_001022246.1 hypothetical protein TTHERM_00500870 [Tetrahymena thermophila SB210]
MSKELVNQHPSSTQGQNQIKASLSNNFLKQRAQASGQKDFNLDMMKLMQYDKQQSYLNKLESLATIHSQDKHQGSKKNTQTIAQSQQSQVNETQSNIDRNLYLKAQQKIFSQNLRIPSKIISFNDAKESNTNQQDNSKEQPSENQKNIKIINIESMNSEIETQKLNANTDSHIKSVDSPFNKTKQNQVQIRNANNQKYFPQSLVNSKFRDSQFQCEIKDQTSKIQIFKEEKLEDKSNQKLDPLSRVRLLKNLSPQSSAPQTFSLSQSSLIEKNNQQNGKKMQMKDLKFESIFIDNTGSHLSNSNQNLIVQSKQQLNAGQKNFLNSQRNFLSVIQNDTNKSSRSQSQSQQNNLNKRRYSANVNQQIQTPQYNQEEKKCFTSFLTDYLLNIKDVSSPSNGLLSPIDKIANQNPSLIKRAQIMSNYNKQNADSQLFFSSKNNNKVPYSTFSQTQPILPTQLQDNKQPGQISIQALIPSVPSKLIQPQISLNTNINNNNNNSQNKNISQSQSEYQIFSIQDFDSSKSKSNIFYHQKNLPSSLQELQMIKSEEDLKTQELNANVNFKNSNKIAINVQSPKQIQDAINNFQLSNKIKAQSFGHNHTFLNHISNLDEYQQKNLKIIKNGISNVFQKNRDYEDSPQLKLDNKEIQFSKSDKIVQKNYDSKQFAPIGQVISDQKLSAKDQGFYSLSTRRTHQQPQAQNSPSSQYLLTNRQSFSQSQIQPKKKFLSFQSQRELPTSDTSYNHIDIAPFSNQNKENTHLQNLMYKVEQAPQISQNVQPKYRLLKQNISLEQSFDNEDEDFYNYTQNIKIQIQNSPQNINLNIDFL